MGLLVLGLLMCATLVSTYPSNEAFCDEPCPYAFNSCNTTNCGQIEVVSTCPPPFDPYACQTGIPTLDFSLYEAYKFQPFFKLLGPYTAENQQVDNCCITIYKTPTPNYFIIYESTVYKNNTNSVATYVALQTEVPGISIFADTKSEVMSGPPKKINVIPKQLIDHAPGQSCVNYIFELLGTSLAIYRCNECLDSDTAPNVIVVGPIRTFDTSYFDQLQETILAEGLPTGGYYVFPNCLPSQCVAEQLQIDESAYIANYEPPPCSQGNGDEGNGDEGWGGGDRNGD